MSVPLIELETEDLVAAAHALEAEIGDALADVTVGLVGALSDCGGMAGDDPGGREWAAAYDSAARAALRASQDAVNGCYQLASMFVHTARNYAAADAASTAGVRRAISRVLAGVPSDTSITISVEVPTAAGGAGGAPHGWGLISHAVGWIWPNGHQDRLRAAGAAWRSSARAFWDVAEFAMVAAGRARSDALPEAGDMEAVCRAMYDHLVQVAHAHRALGDACYDLAGHIDEMHHEVVSELESLLEWTAGIEAGGALLSAVTFGAAELPAQAVESARIARTAARVASIIEKFTALARTTARAVAAVTGRAEAVTARLRALLDIQLTEAAVVGVGRIPIVRMAGELGAAGRLEADALEGVRLFPDREAARNGLRGSLRSTSNRFFKNATSKSRDFKITKLDDGSYRMQFFSPANNPGYGKLYVQIVGPDGQRLAWFKDTLGPEGLIERKWLQGGPE